MDAEHHYRLVSWLSPAYPVGAYSFSHGLEATVEAGLIHDRGSLEGWLAELLACGDIQADLVFLAAAWNAADDVERLADLHELALAFQPTAEIRNETTAQGTAFLKTTAEAWPCAAVARLQRMADEGSVYPVAIGAVARDHGIARDDVMLAYAHAAVANLVSAAVRLVPLGQTDGQRVTAALFPAAAEAVARAADTPLERVSSSCIMADILAMHHETQYTRLFRS